MKKVVFSFSIVLFAITSFLGQEIVVERIESIEDLEIVEEVKVIEEFPLDWENTFNGALRKAKSQNKPVLIYFTGSDWCSPCIVLDKNLFHTEKFKKLADDRLILYKVDVPRNQDLVSDKTRKSNKEISRKYGQKAFPTMILVNGQGHMLDIKKGVYMTDYYYPFFESVLAKFY